MNASADLCGQCLALCCPVQSSMTMSTETHEDMLECSESCWQSWRSPLALKALLCYGVNEIRCLLVIIEIGHWNLSSLSRNGDVQIGSLVLIKGSLVVWVEGDYGWPLTALQQCAAVLLSADSGDASRLRFQLTSTSFILCSGEEDSESFVVALGANMHFPSPPSCLPSVPHRSISLSIALWGWHDTLNWAAHLLEMV